MKANILPECRKKILASPCKQKAIDHAKQKCANQEGRGYGRCMDATYERYLEEECQPVLCQEINRVHAESFQTSAWGDNPLITSADPEVQDSGQSDSEKSKMLLYLGILGGAGLIVLLATRRS